MSSHPLVARADIFGRSMSYGDSGRKAVGRDDSGEPVFVDDHAEDPRLTSPRDPYEKFNRRVFAFNLGLDKYALKPAAQAYVEVTPTFARHGVSNFIANIQEPWSVINSALQWNGDHMTTSLARFVLNSTLGLGGLIDVARRWGIVAQKEDFAQTLAVWHVPSGPYLMLPLLGPSNPRELGGYVASFLADPGKKYLIDRFLGVTAGYATTGTRLFDARVRALGPGDRLLATSLDPYATLKSVYIQKRNIDITNGETSGLAQSEDIFETQ